MNFKKFLESQTYEKIVPKGKEFYHGTIEDYDAKTLRTGNDGVFWTSINKKVSSTYIPVSGSSYYLTTDSLVRPSQDDTIKNIQKSLGINYDYSEVSFNSAGKAQSYHIPKPFSDWYDEERKVSKKLYELSKRKTELRPLLDDYTSDDFDKVVKEYSKIEDEKKELNSIILELDPAKKFRAYINAKLEELGYEPISEGYGGNHNWSILTPNGNIVHANYKSEGRLLTVVPKRDMRIYDMTDGETIESDLMDLQYQKYETFEKLVNEGWDGVKIADYAQHDKMGNVMHYSYGFFDNALKDLEVTNIETAVHPDEINQ